VLVPVLLLLGFPGLDHSHAASSPPNIVFILADDLGYGDVQCLNPKGKILTPHLNHLAAQGIVFTDAHSSSSVCTPTRYGLLTGRYNWRSRLKSGVQGGMSPPLIESNRPTVASFLKQHGYHTACVGKWHLGLGWALKPKTAPFTDTIEKGSDAWGVDFSQPIAHGPTSLGFDRFFGIAASLDMVPYAYIENDRVTQLPTTDAAFPMTLDRTNRWTRRGPGADSFRAEEVLPTLTRQAVSYIRARAPASQNGTPFFLYLPLNAPHTPILPSPEWRGKSGLNAYADFVMQTDASVGEILRALDESGTASNTLVLFASDNGCSPEANFQELAAQGHHPSATLRGAKADLFEGGHRIPLIARWPGRIHPGTQSRQLVCLNDFFATCADILHTRLPASAAEDSFSLLPLLQGRSKRTIRKELVHHSINGSFALRQGPWKLILCADSGGWSAPTPGSPQARTLPPVQLYNLDRDPGETQNLHAAQPRRVAQMRRVLERYIAQGRTTPGQIQP